MNYTQAEIWLIIALMGIGTYLIRFSFLGLIGDRPLHPFLLRLLRFTPVAVLPGMVAPLALWPTATGGEPDAIRLLATLATLIVGVWRKNVIWAVGAGVLTLYVGLFLTGQI
ncbi:Branched-chain amino acid transport protein [Cognatiyoonia koreensis]|uniref:Branched-chain amino acid transport protein n=1 Tax=Cognatiyoonia koreensis TaxID=364200 RepID=A0A1I0RFN4_9RHOB|nr:AzlD domain-containing protein [Cognatiyoonia koreensis]SEW39062.1 Branched-chain amino acid transport protein [Cognatiyoonia koreensis]